ncbi:MAG: hypothetical protein IKD58_05280 [Loktanella sp.]|nr:hypothetical protein [Loktanella sp.]
MTTTHIRPADAYSPLYFLASLGAGGLSVTFFMYLMFWVPYTGRPVPVFEDLMAVFAAGPLALQMAVAVAMAGIAVMAFFNIKLLVWNLGALARFRQTPAFETLRNSNAQVSLLAAPLAVAMTINGLFIVGLVFVPGLWGIVEYLFPFAMLAFLAVGVWALRLIGDFLGRILTKGGSFDTGAHNSFAQVLPAFALAMVAVGLAAPAAMSSNAAVVGIALMLSTFFGVSAIIYAGFAAITGLNAMLQHGTAREAGPTLMVIVPLLTILGILSMRQNHGLHMGFDTVSHAADTMMFMARILAVQVLFVLLGLLVLRKQDYFGDFVFGNKTSPGSYALVCPGVALSVMVQFFVNKGLVAAGLVTKFGMVYWGLTGIAIVAQVLMIALVIRLNRQHFGRPAASGTLVPAE